MAKQKYAVFTMDVEAFTDTGCVSASPEIVTQDLLDGFDEYLRILDKHEIKSTLFTVASVAPKIADKLKSAIDNGHRLALHGLEHTPPLQMPLDVFKSEIQSAKETLSNMFGTEISGYRAPFFSLDNARLDILKELGFKYDSSNLDFQKARHTVKLDLQDYQAYGDGIFYDKDFFEFSISKQKIFGKAFPISGGGYVRLLNWGIVKNFIKQYLQHSSYYVFYLHPFELTQQKIPAIKGLKPYDSYYLQAGIRTYGKHIEQLISMLKKMGYTFVTFEQLRETLSQKTQK